MNNHVPFLDLVAPHRELEEMYITVLRDALRTGRFIGGPMVEEFERQFAAFCGAKYCVGVGSGTDALRFALIAAGVRPGDLVITVPNTFIATTEAISQAGASIAFVDIDERTHLLSPERLRAYLAQECCTDRKNGGTVHAATGSPVRAVVPVHLYGQVAEMDDIRDICAQYGLAVIEDACQAHGATYYSRRDGGWKTAGSMGRAAAFSFYPGKNLGACGEAGALTTNDRDVAERVRMLRDHGQVRKYVHELEGYNGRLDAIQAGFLLIKLKRLREGNERRRKLAEQYGELLRGCEGITVPVEPEWSRGVYHLYVIRTKERDALQKHLLERNVVTGLHYPVPLHRQNAYAEMGLREGAFPAAERACREVLSLPLFPGLTEEQQERVVDGVRRFAEERLAPTAA